MVNDLSPSDLQTWLEWAGARLIAMPGGRIAPAQPHVIWPEYSQETFQVLQFRGGVPLRAAAPSSTEIPIVDEILTFPNVCERDYIRRTLHARSLVHPLNGRYLYKWSRIATLLDVKPTTVKVWHRNGLKEMAEKLEKSRICRVAAFFAEASPSL